MSSIDISSDGRIMISGEEGGSIILWDLEFGEPIARFTHSNKAAFLPDGRTALSAKWDGTVVLWDLFNANEVRRFDGHGGGISDAAFTPDCKTVLSAGATSPIYGVPSEDNAMRLWEVETGEQIWNLEGSTFPAFDIEISPDGRRALSFNNDYSVSLWDLETREEIRRFKYHTLLLGGAFHPDGKRVLISTNEPSLMMWDLESGEIVDHFIGHQGWIYKPAFSPDGKTVLTVDHLQTFILWDVESGLQIRTFSLAEGAQIYNIEFSPDGRNAVSQSRFSSVVVWDTETWEILRVLTGNKGESRMGMLDLGLDGRTVAAADVEGNVLVWDWVSDEILHSFSSRTRVPVFPAISPDGRFLLLGSEDHTLTLWSLEKPSLEKLREWIALNRHVRDLTCKERTQFQIEPLCEESDVENEVLHLPPPSLDEGKNHPTLNAQVGENRGELPLGDWDVWLYEGQAGEVLTFQMIADTPDSSEEELNTVLFVIAPDGSLLTWIDDDPSGELATNSVIEGLVLPVDGTYQIQARSAFDQSAGAYTLIIEVEEE